MSEASEEEHVGQASIAGVKRTERAADAAWWRRFLIFAISALLGYLVLYQLPTGDSDVRPIKWLGITIVLGNLAASVFRGERRHSKGAAATVIAGCLGLLLFFYDSVSKFSGPFFELETRARSDADAITALRTNLEQQVSEFTSKLQILEKRNAEATELILKLRAQVGDLISKSDLASSNLMVLSEEFEFLKVWADAVGGNRSAYDQIVTWSRMTNSQYQIRAGYLQPVIVALHSFASPLRGRHVDLDSPNSDIRKYLDGSPFGGVRKFYYEAPPFMKAPMIEYIFNASRFPASERLDLLAEIVEKDSSLPGVFGGAWCLSLAQGKKTGRIVDFRDLVQEYRNNKASFTNSVAEHQP